MDKELNKQLNNKFIDGKRSDEEMTKDAVLKYCRDVLNKNYVVKDSSVIRLPGINKYADPDYVLHDGETDVLLEVRQSGTGFFFVFDKMRDRSMWCHKMYGWLKKLKIHIDTWVADGQTIMLFIDFSLGKLDKKDLSKQLKEIFSHPDAYETQGDCIRINVKRKKDTKTEIVYAKSTMFYNNRPEHSSLIVAYGFPSEFSDILVEASYDCQLTGIITRCIQEKEQKYGCIADTSKWLAIINVHPLFTANDYKNVYMHMLVDGSVPDHSFQKLFVICDGIAYLLQEQ